MKRISIFLATAAIAALATLSCNKNELNVPDGPVGPKVNVRISGAPEDAREVDPSTRTFINENNGSYTAKWSNEGEALGVVLGAIDANTKPVTLEAEPTTDNNPVFAGELTAEDGTYNVFVFYPASAFGTAYSDGGLGFDLKDVQNPVLGSFDPAADLMGYSSDDAVVEDGSLVLEDIALQRPMAILRINLNADSDAKAFGQKVSSLKMQVPSDLILTGRAKISADGMEWNQTLKHNYVKAEIDLGEEITVGESDGFNAVYLVVNPLLIPAGTEINFIVETEDYNGTTAFNRTVTAPSDMQFQAGNVNVIGLKLRDKDLPTVSDKSYVKVESDGDLEEGQYLIVYEDGGKAFNGGLATLDAASNTIDVVIEDDAIPSTSVTDAAAFTIEALSDGGYSILSASGKYIGQTSDANGLKAQDEPLPNSISVSEGDADILSSGAHLRYNASSGQERFRYFKNASYTAQKAIALYRLEEEVDPTPRITFEGDENGRVEKTVPASTTTVEFPYTKNKYVTELPTPTKVGGLGLFDGEPVVSDNKVTINIIPNTDETDKRIIVKMTGQGIADEGVSLTIVQEAYVPGDTSEDNPYSVAEAVEAAQELDSEGSVEDVYVKGIISRIATAYSSQHNNVSFYISDDGTTGGDELQIFRIPATSEADYAVGDAVEIKGVLKNYQGTSPELTATFEVVYAYKAPSFSPAPGIYTSAQNVTITAADGTPIYYTVDGSAPTTSSSVYSSPISVSESKTIKAFTVVNGVSTGVVTATYTIDAQGNDGSLEHPFTASEARQLALTGNTGSYYITGIVTKVQNQYSASYGSANFWIDENGTAQDVFEGYKIKYFGNVNWVVSNAEIAVDDEVIIYGALTVYNSTTPETSSGYLVSLNGKTKGLTLAAPTVTTNAAQKQITVSWTAATGTESAVSYVVTCGDQTYNASAAGSNTFNMPDYGTYDVTVAASASDAVPATISASATLTDPSAGAPTEYTMEWGADYNSQSVGSYTASWSSTKDGFTVNLQNWNNNNNGWNYIKAGRKNNASVATITTNAAIPEAIKTVTLTIDAVTASKINSLKLYVSSSSSFSDAAAYSFTVGTGAKSVTVSSPAANRYYKIEADCASGSSNGLITVSKLVFSTQ